MNANMRFWLLLGVALVAVVMLTAGSGGSGPPYSPRSVEPYGAKGIVEVLEDLGAEVRTGSPLPERSDRSALMLEDRLRPDDRDELRRWVRNGGVLVVADPFSTFLPQRIEPLPDQINQAPGQTNCRIDALADVRTLDLPPDAWSLDTDLNPACLGTRTQAFVVAAPEGNGAIVAVGSRRLFTNEWLDEADAAVLVVSLLAPDPTDASVAFLGPSLAAFGEEDADDLVAIRVRNAMYMLAASFILYAIHRARRVGAVVPEPLPVHLHGSEVVLQAGLLSERAADPGSAATVLRRGLLSRARGTLALAPESSDRQIAESIGARLGLSSDHAHRVLFAAVETERELLDVAQEIAAIEHTLSNPDPLALDEPNTDQLAASAAGHRNQENQ